MADVVVVGVLCEANDDATVVEILCRRVSRLEVETIGVDARSTHLRWAGVPAAFSRSKMRPVVKWGEKLEPHAVPARRALQLFESLDERPSVVVLLHDIDNDPKRYNALDQARSSRPWPFRVVVGTPDPKREAWILNGFECADERERNLVNELHAELKVHPVNDAHRLRGRDDERDPKRAVKTLTDGHRDREWRCLEDTDLTILRSRGELTRLRAFLDELAAAFAP